jgi:hypothetical protein
MLSAHRHFLETLLQVSWWIHLTVLVCIFDEMPSDQKLQQIASEMNLR